MLFLATSNHSSHLLRSRFFSVNLSVLFSLFSRSLAHIFRINTFPRYFANEIYLYSTAAPFELDIKSNENVTWLKVKVPRSVINIFLFFIYSFSPLEKYSYHILACLSVCMYASLHICLSVFVS